jgi:hypothetical protein
MMVLLTVSLLVGVLLGVALGIQLYNISPLKVGFWEGNVEATDIAILRISHQIRGGNRIVTNVRLENMGAETIACNCTVYYISNSGADLATYSFNATIDAGEVYSRSFTVTPLDVSQWAGTDLSIFEY